ncbi:hypothetical protein [Flavobacterium sp.]|uniref:hypothetical protein n=1 Tax=Flavobacterium sp. TaxID=239 RepID=UPI003752A35C
MKKTLNYLFQTVFVLVFILFASCEKELYEQPIQNSERNLIVKEVSLKSEISKSNSKLMEAVNLLNQEIKGETNRVVYDSILNFYFDDERGLYIESADKHSYTFPIFRTNATDNKIENVLFDQKSDGGYNIYLVKYDITKDELPNYTKEQLELLHKEYRAISVTNRVRLELICVETQSWVSYPHAEGDLVGYSGNNLGHWVTTSSECGWVSGNTGPQNAGGGDSASSSAGGGNSGGGGGTSGSGIYTGISTLSPDDIIIKEFISTLTPEELEWYRDQTEEIKNLIHELVLNEPNSVGTPQSFIKDAITAAMQGVDVDFNNHVIFGITKNCQKEIVKSIFSISSPFTNLIKQTFSLNEKVNIKIYNGVNPGGNPAVTSPIIFGTSDNYTINIKLDNDYLDTATNLSIVAVVLHELVHAYLTYLYISGTLVATDSEYNTLQNAFMTFYNNMTPDTFDPLDNEIHNAMDNFMSNMANSIYNYSAANSIADVDVQYCIDLAWGTMTGTSLFEDSLSNDQQLISNNTAANEQDNLPPAKGTPCE